MALAFLCEYFHVPEVEAKRQVKSTAVLDLTSHVCTLYMNCCAAPNAFVMHRASFLNRNLNLLRGIFDDFDASRQLYLACCWSTQCALPV